ncbi:hypothetical protein KSF78_0001466 [Schistosoma japonicum]|nr:hypothetical protein KSF78_0001466 [Schistosoma japonicum]KAH8853699.1 hypothetical protein KSF78_0001466 [Schistosoma japonicum]KAH8853700.1 hypothetical protein KSF78_0001466 [Schistosoma japonicum]
MIWRIITSVDLDIKLTKCILFVFSRFFL